MDLALVDTGALVAAADRASARHHDCVSLFARIDLRFVIPALCVAEACYLIERDLGPRAEAAFIEGLADWEVVAPTANDFLRMAELVRQYADFPLGGTDASVVALAERYRTEIIVTLDRRHFGAIRPLHCERFRLLPA